MNKCTFYRDWAGLCGKPVAEGSKYCKEHKDVKCVSCGSPATHTCHQTFMFVCGAPLCDNCEHEIFPDGTNGGRYAHCRKSEQKYEPWHVQEVLEDE